MSRFLALSYLRLTPKRGLLATLLFVFTMSLWNFWVIDPASLSSSLRHISALNVRHLPPAVPLALPLPTPVPKYALVRTARGCSELLAETPVNKTRLEWFKTQARDSNPDTVERLRTLIRNCTALKSQHSYWRWPVTPQERLFPLAFGFKVHNAPEMLERFLRVIWRPQNLYIIHVDKTTPKDIFHIFHLLTNCFDNVVLTETRINLVYASVVSLYADIECVKTALRSPVPWKYYLPVSGHEFPLKTNLEMVQILDFLNGTNDVENYRPVWPFLTFLANASIARGKYNFLSNKRRTPFKHKDVKLRKGSAYFAATRKFLEWVLANPICNDYLQWLNETWAADEMFWATANYLPGAPGGGNVEIRHDDDSFLSRAMAWQWDEHKCQGRYVRRVCTFGSGDLKWLISRPELIANKFDNRKDPLVLDCLEKALQDRAEKGHLEMKLAASSGTGVPLLSTLNWTFYKAIPHVKGRKSGSKGG